MGPSRRDFVAGLMGLGAGTPWVDNPMHGDSIQEGDVRLGALWTPLRKWAPKMSVLYGVQVESANHFAGTWQFLRMRARASTTSAR
jgi:hypothetical protein